MVREPCLRVTSTLSPDAALIVTVQATLLPAGDLVTTQASFALLADPFSCRDVTVAGGRNGGGNDDGEGAGPGVGEGLGGGKGLGGGPGGGCGGGEVRA